MPRKETAPVPISAQAQQDLVSDGIENFELPKSLIAKIAKSAIPENSKLQKETVLSLVKGSTVFINYLAATAHDVAVSKQHKSISASDVLKALEMIEFGDLVERLQGELIVYRELAKTDRTKKGSANINNGSISAAPPKPRPAPPTPGTITISAPVPSAKEKEQESAPGLPPPYTSTPLGLVDVGESVSMGSRMAMDLDWDEGETGREGESEGEEVDGVQGEPEEDPDVDVDSHRLPSDDDDDVDDEVEAEAEVYDDPMDIEEEELRRDGRGLDDPHSD